MVMNALQFSRTPYDAAWGHAEVYGGCARVGSMPGRGCVTCTCRVDGGYAKKVVTICPMFT